MHLDQRTPQQTWYNQQNDGIGPTNTTTDLAHTTKTIDLDERTPQQNWYKQQHDGHVPKNTTTDLV